MALPAVAGRPRSVAADTNAHGRITLVVLNIDGQIWQSMQTAGNATSYGPWTQPPGQVRALDRATGGSPEPPHTIERESRTIHE